MVFKFVNMILSKGQQTNSQKGIKDYEERRSYIKDFSRYGI